jgi:hypothetical protein
MQKGAAMAAPSRVSIVKYGLLVLLVALPALHRPLFLGLVAAFAEVVCIVLLGEVLDLPACCGRMAGCASFEELLVFLVREVYIPHLGCRQDLHVFGQESGGREEDEGDQGYSGFHQETPFKMNDTHIIPGIIGDARGDLRGIKQGRMA